MRSILWILSIAALIAIAGCVTPKRSPSSYYYENASNCKKQEAGEANLSALTGYLVGPSMQQQFKSATDKILRPFFSDGCSVSPDGFPWEDRRSFWTHCCIEHDLKYWAGGALEDKQRADEELKTCISQSRFPVTAEIYKFFVNQFGGPQSEKTFRWGYGWNYQRNYRPLSSDEESQVKKLKQLGFFKEYSKTASESYRLVRICNSDDPVFNGISPEDEIVYSVLNQSLGHDDTIEWARKGYYNLDQTEYEVKLERCDKVAKVIIYKKTGQAPQLQGHCK